MRMLGTYLDKLEDSIYRIMLFFDYGCGGSALRLEVGIITDSIRLTRGGQQNSIYKTDAGLFKLILE